MNNFVYKTRRGLIHAIFFCLFSYLISVVLISNYYAFGAEKTFKKDSLILYVNEIYQQELILSNKKISPKNIKWTSSKKTVARVDEKGKIIAKNIGTAVITATYKGKKYKCNVSVVECKLKTVKKTLKSGDTYSQKLYKSNGSVVDNSKIEYSCSDNKIATINKKGIIRAKKPGSVTITLKYKGINYKSKITVKSRITLSSNKLVFNDKSTKKILITVDDFVESITFDVGNNDDKETIVFDNIVWETDLDLDKNVIECYWGEWKGNKIPLYITAKEEGVDVIKISYEGKGSKYDTKYISVVYKEDWTISYNDPDEENSLSGITTSLPCSYDKNDEYAMGIIDNVKLSKTSNSFKVTIKGVILSKTNDWNDTFKIKYQVLNEKKKVVKEGYIDTKKSTEGDSYRVSKTIKLNKPEGDYKLLLGDYIPYN